MSSEILCPTWGGSDYKRVRFSMRHGLAGSMLMSLAKCAGFGATYNRKGAGALTAKGYRLGATSFVLLLLIGFIVLALLVKSGHFDQLIEAIIK